MNKKRVERAVKTVVYAIGTDIVLVYRLHNYPSGGHPPLSWGEIFDRHFWEIIIYSIVFFYVFVCYWEYKEDEDKKRNKKWDKWKDDVGNNTNDGGDNTSDNVGNETDNDDS